MPIFPLVWEGGRARIEHRRKASGIADTAGMGAASRMEWVMNPFVIQVVFLARGWKGRDPPLQIL